MTRYLIRKLLFNEKIIKQGKEHRQGEKQSGKASRPKGSSEEKGTLAICPKVPGQPPSDEGSIEAAQIGVRR